MCENDPLDSALKLAKAAKDILPETTKEADGAVSTLVGWFNNVVLYPIKKANITYRYKLEQFEDDLTKKVLQIPEEELHEPNLMIAGPTLEALKYTIDEEKLREMYINLLASSMDSREDKNVHPSYVEIVRRMNAIDAVVFQRISAKKGYIKAVNPNVGIEGTNQNYINAMPEWYISGFDDMDEFQVSTSLIRLSKFGIVELMYDRTAGSDGYDELQNSPVLQNIIDKYKAYFPMQQLELRITKSVLYVNEYGQAFARTCIKD